MRIDRLTGGNFDENFHNFGKRLLSKIYYVRSSTVNYRET